MKIGYILYWLDGPDSGVFRKVLNQVKFWIAAKNEVTVVLAGPAGKEEAYGKATSAVGAKLKYFPLSGALGRWMRWRPLKTYLHDDHFDILYHRFDLASPGLTAAVGQRPCVLEINTNDLQENALSPGVKTFYNRFSRQKLFNCVSAGVFVTHELAKASEFSAITGPSRKASHSNIVIANGIDFDAFPSTPSVSVENSPNLLFIGSDGQSWHGVDKLVTLAREKPDWKIHAVGVSETMFPNGRPANILTPGRMTSRDYGALAPGCAAGIGTLALHRKGMNEACPLKVREYLALGLPVIIGYVDTDIPATAPYALHIPNTEDNVSANVASIVAFVEQWRGRRVARSEVTHMDWAVKERTRLNFMESLLAR